MNMNTDNQYLDESLKNLKDLQKQYLQSRSFYNSTVTNVTIGVCGVGTLLAITAIFCKIGIKF